MLFFKPLFLFFCLMTASCAAQTDPQLLELLAPAQITGKWTGRLLQGEGGLATTYDFALDLVCKDHKITGSSYIRDEKTKSYAYIELKGELKGSTVVLQEIKVSNFEIIPMAYWCIKKLNLKFDFSEGEYVLSGNWTGNSSLGDCVPGTAKLKKKSIKA